MFFFGKGSEQGFGDSEYTEDSLLGITRPLQYRECQNIFLYFPLGKRLASALVNFAMSAPRKISFNDMPPAFVDRFLEIAQEYDIENIIRRACIQTRIFGLSGLYASHSDIKPHEPLSWQNIQKGIFAFNIADPLNLAGLEISQNPLSPAFQRVNKAFINGVRVHNNRICVLFNDTPLYLQWIDSNLNWGSASIYQNMAGIIKSWNRCVIALERMATKAGSVVYKGRDGSVLSGLAQNVAKKSLELIRNMQNDGAAMIDKDASIEFFSLTGVEVVDSIVSQMNNLILMALSDTPSALLLDKNLAQGFGDGSEDMKTLLMCVNNFREHSLRPFYNFVDKYLLALAFNDSYLAEAMRDYKDDLPYASLSALREGIVKSFSWEFGNLYPDTEATRLDNASKTIDNLTKLKALGANNADLESALNESAIFQNEITLSAELASAEADDMLDYEADEPLESSETLRDLRNDK